MPDISHLRGALGLDSKADLEGLAEAAGRIAAAQHAELIESLLGPIQRQVAEAMTQLVAGLFLPPPAGPIGPHHTPSIPSRN